MTTGNTFSTLAPVTLAEAERLVREQFAVIETRDPALAERNVTADLVNRRSEHEPWETRGRGPAALLATGARLRRAFSDLRFDVHRIALTGDTAVAWVTLHGVHTGRFTVPESPDGAVTGAFPPTGRAFATRQVHWFRLAEGAIAEHDAVRDDLGMAKDVGWIPPTPAYLVRMAIALRQDRRDVGRKAAAR